MTKSEDHRDWEPRRHGDIYCAPACGGGCTWESYQKAKRYAASIAKALGPGYVGYVHENLGWYCGANNESKLMDVTKNMHTNRADYMAIFGGQWVGHGSSPQRAVREAINQAKPSLERTKALVATIEQVIREDKRNGKKNK